jgi:glycosyltransferase involved in cell wall biosynthesis
VNIGKINRSACRQRVEEYFSAPVIAAQYERLYHERIAERR